MTNPQRVDFVTLKLLLAVSSTGSITKAAEGLHLALGAASTRIRDLEERMGVQLLVRHARGVRFTEAGNAVLHHARSIERELAQMEFEVGDFAAGITGHVRVVANASSIATVLPSDLTEFLKTHPRVRIDLAEHTSREIQTLVANGDAEIGVFAGTLRQDGLRVMPYHQDTLVAMVPNQGAWKKERSASISKLLNEDLILLQEGGSIQEWLASAARREGISPRIRVQVKGFDAISQLVAAGLGITVLPEIVARRFSRLLGLRILRITGVDTARALSVCHGDPQRMSPAALDLLNFFNQVAASSDGTRKGH
ncbi:MAG: LysR family transcriptional regulator [Burkholderiaceae bacterium]|nr:LysR family transcriptional regulator [Burkholderiaceae bacterium]